MSPFEILVRTTKPDFVKAAEAALIEADIPHYLEEGMKGSATRFSLSVGPEAISEGTFWTFLVHHEHLENARTVLATLPYDIKTDKEIWDTAPSSGGKRFFLRFVWLVVSIVIILILMSWLRGKS